MRQVNLKRVEEIEFAARKIKVHDKYRQAMLFLCETIHVLREQRDSMYQNLLHEIKLRQEREKQDAVQVKE